MYTPNVPLRNALACTGSIFQKKNTKLHQGKHFKWFKGADYCCIDFVSIHRNEFYLRVDLLTFQT